MLPGLEAEESAARPRPGPPAGPRPARRRAAASVPAAATWSRAGLEERRFLTRRLAEIEERLDADAGARAEAAARRLLLERTLVVLTARRLARRPPDRDRCALAELHEQRRRQSEEARAVTQSSRLRRQRADAERRLEEVRERAAGPRSTRPRRACASRRPSRRCAATTTASPSVAMAAVPGAARGPTAAARARELERELRILGPINPLALEEFTALQERHRFLEAQLEDVKTTRRELQRVIRAVDAEIQRCSPPPTPT